jgi:hypothetical protein
VGTSQSLGRPVQPDRELWRFGSARVNQIAKVRAQSPVRKVGHLLADHNLDRLRDGLSDPQRL